MSGVNDLIRRWRDFALRDVPKEYSERGLTQKFLRSDCAEGGAWDAADELEDVAHTAWKPVSDPPTNYGIEYEMVLVYAPKEDDMNCCVWDAVEHLYPKDENIQWARWKDVVLLPK